jgi:hypothetical protein
VRRAGIDQGLAFLTGQIPQPLIVFGEQLDSSDPVCPEN